jgi:hypothetical protein
MEQSEQSITRIKAYAERAIRSWRDRIRSDEIKRRLLEEQLKELKEEYRRAVGERRKTYPEDIDCTQKSIEKKRYRLDLDKAKIISVLDSIEEIFPGIDNPLKGENSK